MGRAIDIYFLYDYRSENVTEQYKRADLLWFGDGITWASNDSDGGSRGLVSQSGAYLFGEISMEMGYGSKEYR